MAGRFGFAFYNQKQFSEVTIPTTDSTLFGGEGTPFCQKMAFVEIAASAVSASVASFAKVTELLDKVDGCRFRSTLMHC